MGASRDPATVRHRDAVTRSKPPTTYFSDPKLLRLSDNGYGSPRMFTM
ncbi:hypothetical protein ACIGXM_22785 [Kitasatospora sp. NPDC052896]